MCAIFTRIFTYKITITKDKVLFVDENGCQSFFAFYRNFYKVSFLYYIDNTRHCLQETSHYTLKGDDIRRYIFTEPSSDKGVFLHRPLVY